ncbi:hypothetical protein [Aestuariivirga sp.]|uniref:hypothetical protein n=1 Tax=Aestuariivirga sp. TaxID=2650926 RepID=UPI00391B8424
MVALAAMATTATAAVGKPPHDESCKRWELRGIVNGNWLNAPRTEMWVCMSGESKGRTSSANKSSGGSTNGGSAPDASSSDTASSSGNPGKGNNGKGTPNGGKTDGGDPPGGGNTGNDGQG